MANYHNHREVTAPVVAIKGLVTKQCYPATDRPSVFGGLDSGLDSGLDCGTELTESCAYHFEATRILTLQ